MSRIDHESRRGCFAHLEYATKTQRLRGQHHLAIVDYINRQGKCRQNSAFQHVLDLLEKPNGARTVGGECYGRNGTENDRACRLIIDLCCQRNQC